MRPETTQWKIAALAVWLAMVMGCGVETHSAAGAAPAMPRPELSAGFLPAAALPDSLALLPPPPAPDSPAFALDEVISRERLQLRGTPRWQLATQDAGLNFPETAGTFSCALGAPITEQQTPRLYALLRRTMIDAGRSTVAAKNYYQRPRPFVINREPTCTPDWEERMRKNGAYPSGHTTLGWAWALILTEIAPDRADAILARGLAYGESREVCNVHWHSDVVAGRTVGAAVVARLHADPAFLAEIVAARAELAAVRAKGLAPTRDCQAEARALGVGKQTPASPPTPANGPHRPQRSPAAAAN